MLKTWDSKCLLVGGSSLSQVETFSVSKTFTLSQEHPFVKCCCQRIVNISNVNFTSRYTVLGVGAGCSAIRGAFCELLRWPSTCFPSKSSYRKTATYAKNLSTTDYWYLHIRPYNASCEITTHSKLQKFCLGSLDIWQTLLNCTFPDEL